MTIKMMRVLYRLNLYPSFYSGAIGYWWEWCAEYEDSMFEIYGENDDR